MGNCSSVQRPEGVDDMGNRSSMQRPEGVDERGVEKISDSLYKLYGPVGAHEVDIVFFHGLQFQSYADAYWRTWSSDGNTIWPRTLLAKDFPKARVLSVSYNSCARKSEFDMDTIGANLVNIILNDDDVHLGKDRPDDNVRLGEDRPVILVGHSLGGLVIKKFLLTADGYKSNSPKYANFLDDNLAGIFYYATPHGGSIIANKLGKFLPAAGPLVSFLRALNDEGMRLNDAFRKWLDRSKIPVYAIAENRPTSFYGLKAFVVEEASSRLTTTLGSYYTADKNHIDICKPENAFDSTYKLLKKFISDNAKRKLERDLTVMQKSES